MTIVRISRDSGYADRLRAYHVVIDGIKVIKIKNGQSIDVTLNPGVHELFLNIDWCRSNKLNFAITEGQHKYFSCGSSMRGFKLIFSIIYITFLKNSYLWLKELSNEGLNTDTDTDKDAAPVS